MEKFSVGDPIYPRDEDERFEKEEDAISFAIGESCFPGGGIRAIWREEDNDAELICLVFEGVQYYP